MRPWTAFRAVVTPPPHYDGEDDEERDGDRAPASVFLSSGALCVMEERVGHKILFSCERVVSLFGNSKD